MIGLERPVPFLTAGKIPVDAGHGGPGVLAISAALQSPPTFWSFYQLGPVAIALASYLRDGDSSTCKYTDNEGVWTSKTDTLAAAMCTWLMGCTDFFVSEAVIS